MLRELVDLVTPDPQCNNGEIMDLKKMKDHAKLKYLIWLILWIILILFVGKWLWNKALVPSIAIAEPITSIWQILGIIVLFSIILGR